MGFQSKANGWVVVIETLTLRQIVCEKKQDWQLAEERRTEQVEISGSVKVTPGVTRDYSDQARYPRS